MVKPSKQELARAKAVKYQNEIKLIEKVNNYNKSIKTKVLEHNTGEVQFVEQESKRADILAKPIVSKQNEVSAEATKQTVKQTSDLNKLLAIIAGIQGRMANSQASSAIHQRYVIDLLEIQNRLTASNNSPETIQAILQEFKADADAGARPPEEVDLPPPAPPPPRFVDIPEEQFEVILREGLRKGATILDATRLGQSNEATIGSDDKDNRGYFQFNFVDLITSNKLVIHPMYNNRRVGATIIKLGADSGVTRGLKMLMLAPLANLERAIADRNVNITREDIRLYKNIIDQMHGFSSEKLKDVNWAFEGRALKSEKIKRFTDETRGSGISTGPKAKIVKSVNNLETYGKVKFDIPALMEGDLIVRDSSNRILINEKVGLYFHELFTVRKHSKRMRDRYTDRELSLFQKIMKESGMRNGGGGISFRSQLVKHPSRFYKGPDELLNHLEILTGSIDAGNKGRTLRNEVSAVIDRLLEEREISSKDHGAIFKKYVQG